MLRPREDQRGDLQSLSVTISQALVLLLAAVTDRQALRVQRGSKIGELRTALGLVEANISQDPSNQGPSAAPAEGWLQPLHDNCDGVQRCRHLGCKLEQTDRVGLEDSVLPVGRSQRPIHQGSTSTTGTY
ncbi:hypothetical protein AO1008_04130 [Aspergillus oryzae 100-8]|uniref:Uncharacterized protein n=1 Tax=Aspergillus oryzae (strain 3.042) TaxID=1160506 RepID=I8TG38_ASPO3|nr:hypothetical protein Ao3042_11132 [Aspergillus oryzae 3.042]KDE78019.1 hypothetical protein AO1008_04130 [Aspergillus oryzae 100-8]|eukprot:EIT72970.1 hypothetical protein Ao3042_11132 [Aspergillus oryzae 3.042]